MAIRLVLLLVQLPTLYSSSYISTATERTSILPALVHDLDSSRVSVVPYCPHSSLRIPSHAYLHRCHLLVPSHAVMIHFLLLQNRQGKTRLAKYYSAFEHEEKRQLEIEVHKLITKRDPKFTNFIEVMRRSRYTTASTAAAWCTPSSVRSCRATLHASHSAWIEKRGRAQLRCAKC